MKVAGLGLGNEGQVVGFGPGFGLLLGLVISGQITRPRNWNDHKSEKFIFCPL